MSMRINTNIEAFNAQRNLSATGDAYAKSVEKLSSGLRINRAGDDAAGLSISEKLKAQVNGLAQAQRNAQDGISLIQTAEGALNETHSILQRMRELTVQAANDTLADSDRGAIKSEMSQLSAEIDRIAKSTQFNGKNLLDGSLTATKSVSLGTAATGLGSMADNLTDVNASASFVNAAAGNYTFTITNAGSKFTESGATVAVTAQGASETASQSLATLTATGNIYVDGQTIALTIGQNAASVVASINALAPAGVTATLSGGKLEFIQGSGASATFATVTVDSSISANIGINTAGNDWSATASGINANTSTAAGTIVVQSQNGTATVAVTRGETATAVAAAISAAGIGVTASFSGGKLSLTDSTAGNFTVTVNQTSSSSQALTDFGLSSGSLTATAGSDAAGTVSFDGGTATTLTFSAAGQTLSGDGVTLDLTKLGNVTGTVASNNSFSTTYEDKQANLQIGANAQQTLSVGIENMSASALGVDALDVSNGTVINGNDGLGDGKNVDGSMGTLAKIDNAIASVSNQRSTLGAYQNRLEHTISNLGVAQENLSASESRIVDVDMASEMVNFTKLGILQQAGTAILAQANQAPQGVLKLLG